MVRKSDFFFLANMTLVKCHLSWLWLGGQSCGSKRVLLNRNLLGENLNEKLDIKMNPDGSGQLYVPGLTEFSVQSVEDINRVSTSCCSHPFSALTSCDNRKLSVSIILLDFIQVSLLLLGCGLFNVFIQNIL